MIKVRVSRNAAGDIVGLQVSGHAGFANRGEDIVCAGVSALVETALIGLREVAAQATDSEVREGWVSCRLAPGDAAAWERAQVILKTTVLGLKDMAKDYHRFLRVVEEG